MERTTEHISRVAAELGIRPAQVQATSALFDDGATVPFIARYRKEATGLLDEVAVTAIRDRMTELRDLDKRCSAVLKSLEERGLLTDELQAAVIAASTMSELEDVYLPYKPKRRTRATIARERGLEPLAQMIFNQTGIDPVPEAMAFIDAEKGVISADEALAGARDIMAEWVSEDKGARERLRAYFAEHATLRSRVAKDKETEGAKYRDYFQWEEPSKTAPSHRVLAIRRGEREEFLIMRATPPDEGAISILMALFVRGEGADSEQVRLAVEDGYKRLLSFSMEAELRLNLKKRADDEAIRVLQGKPAPTPARPATRGQRNVPRDRPRIPHRMQGSLPRQAGRPQALRDYLPAWLGCDISQGKKYDIGALREVSDRGHSHRQRDRGQRDRGLRASRSGLPGYPDRHGERERRVDILRIRGRTRGVPGPGHHGARLGLDRPQAYGPAGGACKDRPEVHRRRAVPARRGPGRAQAGASTTWW